MPRDCAISQNVRSRSNENPRRSNSFSNMIVKSCSVRFHCFSVQRITNTFRGLKQELRRLRTCDMEIESQKKNHRPFLVLSLDGGGMRGLYTASLLQRLAARFAEQNKRSGELDLGK